jgi:hypothetical protein
MKAILAVFLLSVPLLGQNQAAKGPAACGGLSVGMAVDLKNGAQDSVAPQADKALVYFILETGPGFNWSYPTTEVGIDGKWVGANKRNSYFSFFVSPGEHHLCTAIQYSSLPYGIELGHFTAEAGKVYYFRTQIIWGRDAEYLSVEPVDSDQGTYLIDSFPLAKLRPQK